MQETRPVCRGGVRIGRGIAAYFLTSARTMNHRCMAVARTMP